MSSSSSSGSSSESLSGTYYPLARPKKLPEEKNWIKIGAIVATVAGALIAVLGALCTFGIFPTDLLGGNIGAGMCMAVGAGIALPAGYLTYKHWNLPKKQQGNIS